jgi:hypothetical protein
MELLLSPSGRALPDWDASPSWIYDTNPFTIPLKNPVESVTSVTIKKVVLPQTIQNVDYWPEMPGDGYSLMFSLWSQGAGNLNGSRSESGLIIEPKHYSDTDLPVLAQHITDELNIMTAGIQHWEVIYDDVIYPLKWVFYVEDISGTGNYVPENMTLDFDRCPALAKFFGFWPQMWKTDVTGFWVGQQEVDSTYWFPEVYLVIKEIETEKNMQKCFQASDNVVAVIVFDYPTGNERYLCYMNNGEKSVILYNHQNLMELTISFKVLLAGQLWTVPLHCEEWYVEIYLEQIDTPQQTVQQNLY